MTSGLNRITCLLLSLLLCISILPVGIDIVNADVSKQFQNDDSLEDEEFVISLNGMGASVKPSSITVTLGGIYGELPVPEKKNYIFSGWFTEPNGGEEIRTGDTVAEPVPETLYAMWEGKEHIVRLDPCRGSLSINQIKVKYGDSYPNLPVPYRKGLEFQGWYTQKCGGKLVRSLNDISLDENVTLYAKWAPIWYLQTDKRWKKKWYRVRRESSTIGNAGCGPTAMAMVVASLKNQKVTPVHACKWSRKKGYKAYLSGTKDGFFKKYGKKYGIKVSQIYGGDLRYTKKKKAKKYHNKAKKAVDKGNWVIVLVGKGRWTKGGHFILWYKTEDGYVYIRDSNSTSSKRAKAKLSTLQKQVKRYWIIKVPSDKKVN